MPSRPSDSEHEFLAPGPDLPAVELVRSRARRRQASARVVEGRVVVRVPAGIPPGEEAALVHDLVSKVVRRDAVVAFGGDEALARRAAVVADRWVGGVRPASVAFSHRMDQRWGSCTPTRGSIRIAAQLAAAPGYVLDGVLVHELVHLTIPGHGPDFHEAVSRYPELARSDAYLEGLRRGFALALLADAPDVVEAD